MDQPSRATIIPFPVRPRGELAESAERLSRALADLSAALTEQQDSILLPWLAMCRSALQASACPPPRHDHLVRHGDKRAVQDGDAEQDADPSTRTPSGTTTASTQWASNHGL